jgi:hypothetical protein
LWILERNLMAPLDVMKQDILVVIVPVTFGCDEVPSYNF